MLSIPFVQDNVSQSDVLSAILFILAYSLQIRLDARLFYRAILSLLISSGSAVLLNLQLQAICQYGHAKLKSERTSISITTYPLPKSIDECKCFCLFFFSIASIC